MNKEILRHIGRSTIKKHNVAIKGITERQDTISILIKFGKTEAMFNISKSDDLKKQCEVIRAIIEDEVEFKTKE